MILLSNKHNLRRIFLMNNTNSSNNKDKNIIYIGIFSLIIIIAVIIVLIAKNSGSDTNTSSTNATTVNSSVKPISVVSEKGAQQATVKKNINVRNVKFSQSINKVKKNEAKQKDTSNKPSIAESADGYTYLSYSFNTDATPEFFGTKVSNADASAMLVYVFYNEKLIEVRFQFGNIGETNYNNIVSNITSTYGASTYSRSYSNGTEECWWKTDSVTLDVICQDSSVIAYFRSNSK